ncbi:hypothetical protein JCM3765_000693 [Sporobolomyces pararoseus]
MSTFRIKLRQVDRRLTQLVKVVSLVEISIYFGLFLHHYCWTPHVKVPSLKIPVQFYLPLLSFSNARINTILICALGVTIGSNWNNFTRASPFCYWVGFDTVCYATEIRYRLAQLQGFAVLALVFVRCLEEILHDLEAKRKDQEPSQTVEVSEEKRKDA